MIMGFQPQFVPKILDGTKIHSIRKGHRWKPGMKIHMATGVRTKNYRQFAEKTAMMVQSIYMKRCSLTSWRIDIDTIPLHFFSAERLANNDGFYSFGDFVKWFERVVPYIENKECEFYGQIIHWTPIKYEQIPEGESK